jgi:hypothetical protein
MSRISLAALAVVLSMTSISFAQSYEDGSYASTYNMYSTPAPSGLRFGGADVMIHPKSLDGGPGYGCNTCGADGGVCLDWKLYSWYGSWDGPKSHGHHGRGCGLACGY